MFECFINIDWLQFSGNSACFCDTYLGNLSNYFNCEKSKYGNRYYKQVYDISLDKEKICVLMFEPCSSILKPNQVNIKLDNRLLYAHNLWYYVELICDLLHLKDINLSRFDICADFNCFGNGADPYFIISNLASNAYRKIGKSKFAIYGYQSSKKNTYTGIRYGVHNSELSIYLYNKSLELKEKVYKPYIVERWKEYNINTEMPVWRLEISLHPEVKEYYDKNSGLTYSLNFDTLKNNLVELYFFLANKNFRIVDNSTFSDSNISRRQTLPLLQFRSNGMITSNARPLYKHNISTTYDKGIKNYLSNFERTKLYELNDLLFTDDITTLKRAAGVLKRLLRME